MDGYGRAGPEGRPQVRRLACTLVIALVCAAGLCGIALPVEAQATVPAFQVLTLDQDRLYMESLFGKALEARITSSNQELAAENRKIEQDLASEEAELTQKRPTMSPMAFQVLADGFDARVEQLRAGQTAKAEAAKSQREAGRKGFFQASVPVLADLMRQSGAYAILNRSAVVLAFDAIDVTDQAIRALDEKLGDGSKGAMGPRLPAAPSGTQGGTPDLGTPAPTTELNRVPNPAPNPAPNAAPNPVPNPVPNPAP